MIEKRDEPTRLTRLKKILSLFKPGGLEELRLILQKAKQKGEYSAQQGKINMMMLNPADDIENLPDIDFEKELSVLDSLNNEIIKTDSLLGNIRGEDRPTPEELSQDVLEMISGGGAVGRLTNVAKKKLAKDFSSKFKITGDKSLIEKYLKPNEIEDYVRNFFGKRDFFGLVRGMQSGKIKPGDKAFDKGTRVLKLFEEAF